MSDLVPGHEAVIAAVATRMLHRPGEEFCAADIAREAGVERARAHEVLMALVEHGLLEARFELLSPYTPHVVRTFGPGETLPIGRWVATGDVGRRMFTSPRDFRVAFWPARPVGGAP